MCYLKDAILRNIILSTENVKFTRVSLITKALIMDIGIIILINFHHLKQQKTVLILLKTVQWFFSAYRMNYNVLRYHAQPSLI